MDSLWGAEHLAGNGVVKDWFSSHNSFEISYYGIQTMLKRPSKESGIIGSCAVTECLALSRIAGQNATSEGELMVTRLYFVF